MKPKFYAAQGLFFPAAAIHALLVVPLSVYAMTSGQALLPGLARSSHHGHEMLFGFALAVVVGFLVNRISGPRLGMLFGAWLAARVTYWWHSLRVLLFSLPLLLVEPGPLHWPRRPFAGLPVSE